MTARVCVIGSFMADLIAYAPRRPAPGETLVGTSFGIFLGGKGFNQATAARRMGAETSFIGRLGDDDFGQQFFAALQAEGIDTTAVSFDAEIGTGVGLPVVEPSGQNSIIIVPQANTTISVQEVRRAASTIEAADVLLIQLELPMDSALEAATIARRTGTTVVLNPAPFNHIPDQLLKLTDVLVPNEVEARELLGTTCPADAVELAAALHRRWDIAVVTTLGSDGCVVVTTDGSEHRIPAQAVEAIDTVGAGDTFCGCLGAELAAGRSLVEAASVANRAAAIAVTRSGGAAAAPRRE